MTLLGKASLFACLVLGLSLIFPIGLRGEDPIQIEAILDSAKSNAPDWAKTAAARERFGATLGAGGQARIAEAAAAIREVLAKITLPGSDKFKKLYFVITDSADTSPRLMLNSADKGEAFLKIPTGLLKTLRNNHELAYHLGFALDGDMNPERAEQLTKRLTADLKQIDSQLLRDVGSTDRLLSGGFDPAAGADYWDRWVAAKGDSRIDGRHLASTRRNTMNLFVTAEVRRRGAENRFRFEKPNPQTVDGAPELVRGVLDGDEWRGQLGGRIDGVIQSKVQMWKREVPLAYEYSLLQKLDPRKDHEKLTQIAFMFRDEVESAWKEIAPMLPPDLPLAERAKLLTRLNREAEAAFAEARGAIQLKSLDQLATLRALDFRHYYFDLPSLLDIRIDYLKRKLALEAKTTEIESKRKSGGLSDATIRELEGEAAGIKKEMLAAEARFNEASELFEYKPDAYRRRSKHGPQTLEQARAKLTEELDETIVDKKLFDDYYYRSESNAVKGFSWDPYSPNASNGYGDGRYSLVNRGSDRLNDLGQYGLAPRGYLGELLDQERESLYTTERGQMHLFWRDDIPPHQLVDELDFSRMIRGASDEEMERVLARLSGWLDAKAAGKLPEANITRLLYLIDSSADAFVHAGSSYHPDTGWPKLDSNGPRAKRIREILLPIIDRAREALDSQSELGNFYERLVTWQKDGYLDEAYVKDQLEKFQAAAGKFEAAEVRKFEAKLLEAKTPQEAFTALGEWERSRPYKAIGAKESAARVPNPAAEEATLKRMQALLAAADPKFQDIRFARALFDYARERRNTNRKDDGRRAAMLRDFQVLADSPKTRPFIGGLDFYGFIGMFLDGEKLSAREVRSRYEPVYRLYDKLRGQMKHAEDMAPHIGIAGKDSRAIEHEYLSYFIKRTMQDYPKDYLKRLEPLIGNAAESAGGAVRYPGEGWAAVVRELFLKNYKGAPRGGDATLALRRATAATLEEIRKLGLHKNAAETLSEHIAVWIDQVDRGSVPALWNRSDTAKAFAPDRYNAVAAGFRDFDDNVRKLNLQGEELHQYYQSMAFGPPSASDVFEESRFAKYPPSVWAEVLVNEASRDGKIYPRRERDKIFEYLWKVRDSDPQVKDALLNARVIDGLFFFDNKKQLALWQLENIPAVRRFAGSRITPGVGEIREGMHELAIHLTRQFDENSPLRSIVVEAVAQKYKISPAEAKLLAEYRTQALSWKGIEDSPRFLAKALMATDDPLALFEYLLGQRDRAPSLSEKARENLRYGRHSAEKVMADFRRSFQNADDVFRMTAILAALDEREGLLANAAHVEGLQRLLLGRFHDSKLTRTIAVAYLQELREGERKTIYASLLNALRPSNSGKKLPLGALVSQGGPFGARTGQNARLMGNLPADIRAEFEASRIFDKVNVPSRFTSLEQAQAVLGDNFKYVVAIGESDYAGSINTGMRVLLCYRGGVRIEASLCDRTKDEIREKFLRIQRDYAEGTIRNENDVLERVVNRLRDPANDPEVRRAAGIMDELRRHSISTMGPGEAELDMRIETRMYPLARDVYEAPAHPETGFRIEVAKPDTDLAGLISEKSQGKAMFLDFYDAVPLDKVDEPLRGKLAAQIMGSELDALFKKGAFDPDGTRGQWLVDLKNKRLVRVDYAQFVTDLGKPEIELFRGLMTHLLDARPGGIAALEEFLAKEIGNIFDLDGIDPGKLRAALGRVVRARDFPTAIDPVERLLAIQFRLAGELGIGGDSFLKLQRGVRLPLATMSRIASYREFTGAAAGVQIVMEALKMDWSEQRGRFALLAARAKVAAYRDAIRDKAQDMADRAIQRVQNVATDVAHRVADTCAEKFRQFQKLIPKKSYPWSR